MGQEGRKLKGFCPQYHGKALTRPQKVILDAAMDKQLQILQQQIEKLKSENSSLSKKNLANVCQADF